MILQYNKAMEPTPREQDPWLLSTIQNGKRILTVKNSVSVSSLYYSSVIRYAIIIYY
jgi:hypothetical protein